MRLDSFKIGAFDDVVDAICRQKGFANPIPIDEFEDEPPPEPADLPSPPQDETT
jgi:hypothetical protein